MGNYYCSICNEWHPDIQSNTCPVLRERRWKEKLCPECSFPLLPKWDECKMCKADLTYYKKKEGGAGMSTTNRGSAQINWEKVAEEMPGAYAKWYSYIKQKKDSCSIEQDPDPLEDDPDKIKFSWLIGHLLAFFDERGIEVCVERESQGWICSLKTIENPSLIFWVWYAEDQNYYTTRPEALAGAFIGAFRVLEDRLKGTEL